MSTVIAVDVPQDGARPTPGIRVAAEYRWAHPAATWAEVAQAAGCHRNTLERWRDTEAWEAAMRTAGAEHVDSLAPAAVAALRKSWERGNAAGAIEVLRALGFLKLPTAATGEPAERVRFTLDLGDALDRDAPA
jgi:hypothetical protein